jgi:hypothetical protein
MTPPSVFLTPEQIEALPWQPCDDAPPGLWERILAVDEATGSYTRLSRADPGHVQQEVRVHDYLEESWLLEGSFEEDGVTYGAGTFVVNPPGVRHGPYTSATGWLALERVTFDRHDG